MFDSEDPAEQAKERETLFVDPAGRVQKLEQAGAHENWRNAVQRKLKQGWKVAPEGFAAGDNVNRPKSEPEV